MALENRNKKNEILLWRSCTSGVLSAEEKEAGRRVWNQIRAEQNHPRLEEECIVPRRKSANLKVSVVVAVVGVISKVREKVLISRLGGV